MILYAAYYIANALALLLSLIKWQKAEPALKYQWIYLAINLGSELLCHYLKYVEHLNKTTYLTIYNVVIPIEYVFFMHLINTHIANKTVNRLINASMIVFTVYSFIYLLYLHKFYSFDFNFNTRSLLFICAICYYYYELYYSDELIQISREPVFWISSGFFIFCISSFFVMGLNAVLSGLNEQLANTIYQVVLPSLNIFLYITFIVAALCRPMRYR